MARLRKTGIRISLPVDRSDPISSDGVEKVVYDAKFHNSKKRIKKTPDKSNQAVFQLYKHSQ